MSDSVLPAQTLASQPAHNPRRRLTLWLTLACAVVCAVVMLWKSERTHSRTATVVSEIQSIDAVRATISALLSTISDAEYQQRQYALTLQQPYLSAYQEDDRQITLMLHTLDTQSPPQITESTMMRDFKRLLLRQTGAMALTVRLASQGQADAAQHVVDSDAAMAPMQQLRQQADRLVTRTDRLVTDKRTELRQLIIVSRIGLAVGVLAALIAFFLYVRQTSLLQQADARQQRILKSERDALESQVRERTARLTELANYLQQAVEDERDRLARELHDELGALLTAAKIEVARLKSKLPLNATEPMAGIQHLSEILNQCNALKRQIIEDLRPSSLSDLGLVASLEILTREFSEHTTIPVHAAIDHPVLMDETSELTIYRLAQEALTNIAKYARASEVTVALTNYDHHTEITVADDGVGFDPTQTSSASHGLIGMRHRVEALGGRLIVDSSPGRGTRVTGFIPHRRQPAATAAAPAQTQPDSNEEILDSA